MTYWTDQINRHTVILPRGITPAMNGRIPPDLLVDVHNGHGRRIGRLNKPAAWSWKAMVAHALRDGVILDATDTYRTIESQQHLWDTRYDHTNHGNGGRTCGDDHRYLKDGEATAACPGTSNHGYAGAIDDKVDNAGHAWLERHAGTYGWEWELKSEKWHLHYWPGDVIPQAVLDFEAATNIVTPGGDQMQMFGQSDNKTKDGGRIYLVDLELHDMWYIPNTPVLDWIRGFNDLCPPDKKFLVDGGIHTIPQAVIEAIPLIPARVKN
jgi:hypothetical protein